MRTLTTVSIGLIVALVLGASAAQAELPTSLEQFQEQITAKAGDPKGATGLFFDAIYVYLAGEKDLGKQLIMEMSRYKEWSESNHRMLLERMESMPHIYRSYAVGATPENAYQMDPQKYELAFHGEVNLEPYADKAVGEFAKLFIRSGGPTRRGRWFCNATTRASTRCTSSARSTSTSARSRPRPTPACRRARTPAG